jgi:hypothetical protein
MDHKRPILKLDSETPTSESVGAHVKKSTPPTKKQPRSGAVRKTAVAARTLTRPDKSQTPSACLQKRASEPIVKGLRKPNLDATRKRQSLPTISDRDISNLRSSRSNLSKAPASGIRDRGVASKLRTRPTVTTTTTTSATAGGSGKRCTAPACQRSDGLLDKPTCPSRTVAKIPKDVTDRRGT